MLAVTQSTLWTSAVQHVQCTGNRPLLCVTPQLGLLLSPHLTPVHVNWYWLPISMYNSGIIMLRFYPAAYVVTVAQSIHRRLRLKGCL